MDVEYSLGPFCNWFIPSCLDIWSSIDGNEVLVSYGARSMICLLRVTNDKSIKCYDSVIVFNIYKSIISCAKFAKNGLNSAKIPYLFIGSNEGEAAVMDCHTKEIIYQKSDINALSFPSQKILTCDWSQSDGSLVYYSMHSIIVCWNTKTGNIKQLMIGEYYQNKTAISCIVTSNCGHEKLAVGFMNGDIILLYIKNMSNISNLNVEHSLIGHNDDICSLSFSWTKGQYEEGILASVSRDGFVKVWDIDRKYIIADIKLDSNKSKNKNWFSTAILPIQSFGDKFEILIGSGNGDLLTIEIPTKPPSSKIRVHKPFPFNKSKNLCHNSIVFSIAIDIKTMLAITSSLDHQILLWDLCQRKAINSFGTFSHGVHDISFSPIDPLRVAVAVGTGYQIIKFNQHLSVVNERRIPLFSRGKDVKGLAVVWHPELENRIAFGTSNGEILVTDINSSQKNPKYTTKMSKYDSSKIYNLIWGPPLSDSANLLTDESTLYCIHQSGNLFLHYISSNKVLNFTHYVSEEKKRTAISWKSNYNHLSVGNDDGTVDVFQHQNHELDLKLRINAFNKTILCIKWNSNKDEETSNWLAISSYHKTIHCYSLHNYFKCNNDSVLIVSKPNCVLTGHLDRISSMSWCPHDPNKLVSVSYDRTAQIWDVLNETPLINFRGHRGILYTVLWSAFDEDVIFSGGEDNYFHVWRPSKQTHKTPHNSNTKESLITNSSDSYWPHLEEDNNSNEGTTEATVTSVLNECINKVVLSHTSANEYHDLYVEECHQQKQKTKIKINKKKITKELKKLSLFPLSNSIEKSSSKYQKMEDIEALVEKLVGKDISEERNERILLYGNSDDIKAFVKSEVLHHISHGNKEQKDILDLFIDIKSTIEESLERKETNSYFVSLSMSVSRKHWKESCSLLAQMLTQSTTELSTFDMYKIEMSAILLISLNEVKKAIDLLIENQLFRESIIVSKLSFESEELVEHIVRQWAKFRINDKDFEGAAKCLTSIRKFTEAADLLDSRNDQQFDHTICLLRSIKT